MKCSPYMLTGIICLLVMMFPGRAVLAADPVTPSITLSPMTNDENFGTEKYVFDVVIHNPEDMDKLLGRIESLAQKSPPGEDSPGLALVLHGPEIAFFSRRNYPKYMNLVDRAAALDKKGIIDVKVCDTMIRELNIKNEDLPDYVEHVPYGPAEVERLVRQGFIRM